MSIYDDQTAGHYAAFRPPLHELILDKFLCNLPFFESGLDIGCGTGTSSMALAGYCKKVIGIDPSLSMLDRATFHPQVTYLPFDGSQLDLFGEGFDIITFAGSLFYAKSQSLLDEVVRVGKNKSLILIYDFEIVWKEILERFGIQNQSGNTDYNHMVDFSGLELSKVEKVISLKEMIKINILAENLVHVFLAEEGIYPVLKDKFPKHDLYEFVSKALSKEKLDELNANIFLSVYQIKK
jgi:ubiquinone/menaquinone biosynthesis C-methylase UbiE